MKPLKVLFATAQNSAVGYYRHWVPARMMKAAGHDVTVFEYKGFSEWANPSFEAWAHKHRGEYDIVFTTRPSSREHLMALRAMTFDPDNPKSKEGRLVVDHDDNHRSILYWNDRAHKSYKPTRELRRLVELSLQIAEFTTFSTEILAGELSNTCRAWGVYHNRLDPGDWVGLPVDPDRKLDPALRIFYGGAGGHYGDMDEIREPLEAFLRKTKKQVRLVVLGTAPRWVHDLNRLRPGLAVALPWVPFQDYPAAVAWGGFDMAVVPLANNDFNKCKSIIKGMEAAVQGIPTVLSRVPPYDALPGDAFYLADNNFVSWEEAIELMATSPELRDGFRSRAREWAPKWFAESGVEEWNSILERIMEQPPITDSSQLQGVMV